MPSKYMDYNKRDTSIEYHWNMEENYYRKALKAIKQGDGESAEKLLHTAAFWGSMKASQLLGRMYLNGECGLEQNYTYARQCFWDVKTPDIKKDWGEYCRALLFDDTVIYKSSFAYDAVRGYKEGNVECFFMLGKAYELGHGCKQNLSFAKYFFELYKAAGGTDYEVPMIRMEAVMPYMMEPYGSETMEERLSWKPELENYKDTLAEVAHLFKEGMSWEEKMDVLKSTYRTFNNNGMNESMASTMAAGIENEQTRWWEKGRKLLKPINVLLTVQEAMEGRKELERLVERDREILRGKADEKYERNQ